MGACIAKQPNGRYCRYSTVVETITHFNLTKEDYLNNVTGTTCGRADALDTLENYLHDFDYVISCITTSNTTEEEKKELIRKMSSPCTTRYEIF